MYKLYYEHSRSTVNNSTSSSRTATTVTDPEGLIEAVQAYRVPSMLGTRVLEYHGTSVLASAAVPWCSNTSNRILPGYSYGCRILARDF